LQLTRESDTHAVALAADQPPRPLLVHLLLPRFAPLNITLLPPLVP
jgi:hypothetical protein